MMAWLRKMKTRREIARTFASVVVWEVRGERLRVYRDGVELASIPRQQFPFIIEKLADVLCKEPE